MKVLHVISCLVKADGHSQFCMTLAERMVAPGLEQRIFSLPSEDGAPLSDPKGLIRYASGQPIHVFNVSVRLGLEKQLAAVMRNFQPDVVHLHGGWHPVLFFGARLAKRMSIPIVLSLHGSLRPVVVEGDRRLKKRLAWRLYQRRLVGLADVIHVSTETEREDLARLGFDKPVVVVPNGVDLEPRNTRKTRNPEEDGGGSSKVLKCGSALGNETHTRTVLYLGRLHPIKGLDLLISAWKQLVLDFNDWHLLIVGSDEQGVLAKLREQVKRLELEDRITFGGPAYGDEKIRIMSDADLFVLPTRGENFGIVVVEALACGVPVITTKGAPWQELLGSPASAKVRECESALVDKRETSEVEPRNTRSTRNEGDLSQLSSVGVPISVPSTNELTNSRTNELARPGRAGWWVDIGVEPLAEAMREAMGLTDEERRQMGENGRRLVERKYRWEAVAEKMMEVYENSPRESRRRGDGASFS